MSLKDMSIGRTIKCGFYVAWAVFIVLVIVVRPEGSFAFHKGQQLMMLVGLTGFYATFVELIPETLMRAVGKER